MTIDPAKLWPPGVRTLAPYVPGKPLEELEREYGISDSIKLARTRIRWARARGRSQRSRAASRHRPLSGRQRLQAEAGARAQARLRHRYASRSATARTTCSCCSRRRSSRRRAKPCIRSTRSRSIRSRCRRPGRRPASHRRSRGHAMPLGHDLAALAQLINERTRWCSSPTRTIRPAPGSTPMRCGASCGRAGADAGSRRRGLYRIRDRADFPDASRWLGEFPNLIVTRTFSKVYGRRGCASATRCRIRRWRTCSIACASRSTSTRSRSPRRWPRSTTAST